MKPSRTLGNKSVMVATETYLKTRQVADGLGVSVSTIKRWVDSGAMEATRTMGRHRLVLLSGALEFARRENFSLAGLLSLSASPNDRETDQQVQADLLDALKKGATGEACRLIFSAHQSGRGADGLADRVIQPVMAAIGRAWMVGSCDIYQERQATQIITLALNELVNRSSRAMVNNRPLALGASIEGDHYCLPGILGELVLREVGWDIRNLGCNLPLRSFARAIRDHKPRLAYLPVSHLADRSEFLRDYAYVYEAATLADSAIILGGRALDRDLRSKLIHASFGDRMVHLAEFARRLLSPKRRSAEAELDRPRTSPTLD